RPALCAVAFGGGSTVGAPVATAPVAGGLGGGVCSISTAEIGALGGVGLAGLGISVSEPRAPALSHTSSPTPLSGRPVEICELQSGGIIDDGFFCSYWCPLTGRVRILPFRGFPISDFELLCRGTIALPL